MQSNNSGVTSRNWRVTFRTGFRKTRQGQSATALLQSEYCCLRSGLRNLFEKTHTHRNQTAHSHTSNTPEPFKTEREVFLPFRLRCQRGSHAQLQQSHALLSARIS